MHQKRIEYIKETLERTSSMSGRSFSFELKNDFIVVYTNSRENVPVYLSLSDKTLSFWSNKVDLKDSNQNDIEESSLYILKDNISLETKLPISSTPIQVFETIETLLSKTPNNQDF